MDQVLQFAINEISVNGPEGMELNELWEILEKKFADSKCLITPLEDNTKDYILGLLRKIKSVKFDGKLYCENDEITGHLKYSNINWDTPVLKILKFIQRRREKGATQIEISHHFEMDPKTTFHHLKILSTTDLIQKISVLASGSRTNLFIHKRFSTNQIDHNLAITKDQINNMLTILKESTNQTLKCQDLMVLVGIDTKQRPLRKSFYRLLYKLQREKYLEFIAVSNQKNGLDKCVRLLEYPYVEKKNKPIMVQNTTIGLKQNLAFDVQLYLLIKKNNNSGMTIKDICHYFPTIPKKKIVNEIHRLEGKTKGLKYLKAVQENVGKSSRFVYFINVELPWADEYVDAPLPLQTPRKISKIAKIKQYILSILETERVHDANQILEDKINELAREWDHLEHRIDRKTIRKAINLLELDNEVKTFNLAVPIPNGNIIQKNIITLPNYNLEHPLVKNQIELYKQNYFRPSASKPIVIENMEIDRIETPKKPDLDDSPNWKEFAKKYGFIGPKNKRAKLLHQWLLDQNRDIIETSWIFNQLTLGLALQIVGQTRQSDELDEYLINQEVKLVKLCDLPQNIKNLKFNKSRFRYILYELLHILITLELIRPMHYDHYTDEYTPLEEHQSIALYYEIHQTINLYDYSKSPPVVEHVFHSESLSVENYWKQLEYECLSCPPNEDEKYSFLFVKKNWKEVYSINAEQKSVLESYVDYKTKSTPLQNDFLCQSLSRKISLSITMIKYYYSKIEKRFSKSIGERVKPKKKPVEKVVEEEPEEKVKGRRLRMDWSAEDDENILISFVILSNFSIAGKFPLAYLPQLFPSNSEITKDRLRRRIIILKRKYSNIQKIAFYRSQWPKYQAMFEQTQVIDFPYLSNNLIKLLQGFKSYIKEFQMPTDHDLSLPQDIETFEQNYQINEDTTNFMSIENGDPIHVQLESRRYLTSKTQFLYSISFTHEVEPQSDYQEYEMTEQDLHMHLLASIIKMISITPSSLYRPEIAWLTLKKFDEEDIKKTTNQLVEKYVLIRKSYGKGKQFSPSDKFVELLCGILPPKLFGQSASYLKSLEKNLAENGKTALPVRKEPGVMAVLLELFLQENLEFVVKIPEVQIDDPNLVSNIKIQIVQSSRSSSKRKEIESDDEIEPSKSADRSVNVSQPQLECDRVLDELDKAGILGLTFKRLQEKTKLKDLDRILHVLENDKVLKVGFDFTVYIHEKYKHSWLIEIEKPVELADVDTELSKTFTTPKLWYTLTGEIIPNVYKACCELVLGVLVESPGLILCDLQKRVEIVLSKFELSQILEELEKRQAIKARKVTVLKESENVLDGLFSDEEYEVVTAYYPGNRWYAKAVA